MRQWWVGYGLAIVYSVVFLASVNFTQVWGSALASDLRLLLLLPPFVVLYVCSGVAQQPRRIYLVAAVIAFFTSGLLLQNYMPFGLVFASEDPSRAVWSGVTLAVQYAALIVMARQGKGYRHQRRLLAATDTA